MSLEQLYLSFHCGIKFCIAGEGSTLEVSLVRLGVPLMEMFWRWSRKAGREAVTLLDSLLEQQNLAPSQTQRKVQIEIGGGIAKENGYKPVLSGRRLSFGFWGVGTVSVSEAQDVDTAAAGMAFDRLRSNSSAGVPFLRSIKTAVQVVIYVSLPNSLQIARFCHRFRISLLLRIHTTCTVLVHTCVSSGPSPDEVLIRC